ncbi:hypothetical protein OJAV_G00111610 [Oryzias javanicus]|uniref:Uncharacterized protein n=1 Tax=Oryzias javanicus TaxID=123683 RepID=A0A3S2P569_ORYJA|nr:hypothetical protein OJAV_G00111610 [Oryzias javanicus]
MINGTFDQSEQDIRHHRYGSASRKFSITFCQEEETLHRQSFDNRSNNDIKAVEFLHFHYWQPRKRCAWPGEGRSLLVTMSTSQP